MVSRGRLTWRHVSSRNLFIQEAPVDPSHLFVRPEVRGQYEGHPVEIPARCKEVAAPGDAMLESCCHLFLFQKCGWKVAGVNDE